MFLNAIYSIRFGINMGGKKLLYCASERNKYFLTLEDKGGIFCTNCRNSLNEKSTPTTPHFTNTVWCEMWSIEMYHDDKNERWGGEGVYRDACYHSFPLRCGMYKTWSSRASHCTLYKRRHISIVCVCWHISIGTLVTHCTTVRSFVPLKSRQIS